MDIENDLKYLAETDEIFAQESGQLDFLKDNLKAFKGNHVIKSNMATSKAQEDFYASSVYKTAIKDINLRAVAVNTLRNKRATAILRIDVWRTLEASRRKGNIQ